MTHNLHNLEPQLRQYFDAIKALEAEIADLQESRRDTYAEAKAAGVDVKSLRAAVRLSKRDPAEVREEQEALDRYLVALGIVSR